MLKALFLESLPAIDIFGTRRLFDFLVKHFNMDLLWMCGKSFGAQVHGSEKWQANCDLLTFHKLNIDNHGIPQTAQYQLLGCRYKQTMFFQSSILGRTMDSACEVDAIDFI